MELNYPDVYDMATVKAVQIKSFSTVLRHLWRYVRESSPSLTITQHLVWLTKYILHFIQVSILHACANKKSY